MFSPKGVKEGILQKLPFVAHDILRVQKLLLSIYLNTATSLQPESGRKLPYEIPDLAESASAFVLG
jgi:hypothetical protein